MTLGLDPGFLYALPLFHFAPADKAVQVVDQEDHKADENGNISDIFDGCQGPQNH